MSKFKDVCLKFKTVCNVYKFIYKQYVITNQAIANSRPKNPLKTVGS
jgi:hypothetical protein